jgi:tyrosyl-tRNA synthetase
VADCYVRANLEHKLRAGRQLRIKFGVDPSRPDIHVGHAVGFRKLREFQELGHTVVVIVGDWTAQIGDPSGRSTQRAMLSADEVRENARTYLDQFFKVIDIERSEIVSQSAWFGSFGLDDVVRLSSTYTVARMLKRDDFAARFASDAPIAVTEFLYPLLQAYDSVAVQADLEVGGTDQMFNLLVGRDVQRAYGQEPQDVLTWPLLVGTDGVQKMSKSVGNYVGVTEPSSDAFGKLMSLPDSALEQYLRLVTDIPPPEIDRLLTAIADGSVNPRDVKERMALEVVRDLHGAEAATAARDEFARVFRAHELPREMPEVVVELPTSIMALLVRTGLATSNNDARRLIEQGGVRLDGVRASGGDDVVSGVEPIILQVGRRRFLRLVPGPLSAQPGGRP